MVEIDPTGGPRYGLQQYPEHDFLHEGEVVLTFDDGPLRANTQLVLGALAEHCTKGTFFMVGRMAAADPAMVKEVARRGHTIGSHTWSHQNLRAVGPRAKAEVELGLSAVRRAAGQEIAPFFRFPFLADSRAMTQHLQSRNIAIFSIDVDGYDYRTPNPEDVHRAMIGQITHKRKGILLFHDIQLSTARALRGILDDLKRRGFRVVHMVPTGHATTLAEFDGMASRESRQVLIEAGSLPLESRSVVAPIAGSRQGGQVFGSQGTETGPMPGPLPPIVGPPAGQVPRQTVRRGEDDWRSRVFGN